MGKLITEMTVDKIALTSSPATRLNWIFSKSDDKDVERQIKKLFAGDTSQEELRSIIRKASQLDDKARAQLVQSLESMSDYYDAMGPEIQKALRDLAILVTAAPAPTQTSARTQTGDRSRIYDGPANLDAILNGRNPDSQAAALETVLNKSEDPQRLLRLFKAAYPAELAKIEEHLSGSSKWSKLYNSVVPLSGQERELAAELLKIEKANPTKKKTAAGTGDTAEVILELQAEIAKLKKGIPRSHQLKDEPDDDEKDLAYLTKEDGQKETAVERGERLAKQNIDQFPSLGIVGRG